LPDGVLVKSEGIENLNKRLSKWARLSVSLEESREEYVAESKGALGHAFGLELLFLVTKREEKE
jgi:hypothetical protein